MEKKHVVADIEIIREGMDGTHMYVLEKGQVQVSKGQGTNKESVATLHEGNVTCRLGGNMDNLKIRRISHSELIQNYT